MSTSQAKAAVPRHFVTERFNALDLELRKWENFRNEQGGFDLSFGEEPRIITLSGRVNETGDIVCMVKQSEQTPVLRRHGWFAFETFATRMVIEHFQSIPRIVHEIMQYLYLETREAQFEYNLYYDWTGAKKEIEVVFGVNSAQLEAVEPAAEPNAPGEEPEVTARQRLSNDLYRLAAILARARAQSDDVKLKYVAESVATHRTAVLRENKIRLTGAFGKMDFPVKSYTIPEGADNVLSLVNQLTNALRANDTHFSYSFKSIIQLPPVIHHMKALTSLSFEHARLATVPSSVFELPFLVNVQLNDNQLISLPPLGGSPLIEHLSVQGNRLVALPDDIGSLQVLTSLQAERNCLTSLPHTLASCMRLNHLNVSSNRISHIPPVLSLIPELVHIGFSRNPIRNVPPEVALKGSACIMEFLKSALDGSLGAGTFRDLADDFLKAAADTNFPDIVFKPRGARAPILAHRVFIAGRVPKLYTYVLQLEMGLAETSDGTPKPPPAKDDKGRSIIPMNDMDSATFEMLKTWIYHDKFQPDVAKVHPLTPDATFEQQQAHQQAVAQSARVYSRILKVAETYCIAGLIKMIEKAQGMPPEMTATLRLPPEVPYYETFRSLLNRPELSDAVFIVDGERIYAHKVILSSRSIFFEGMFQAKMLEANTGEIILENVSYPVIWSILVFCYRGEVLVAGDYALDLLNAARLYGLPRLAHEVQAAVAYSLELDNVGAIYEYASEGKYDTLSAACVQFANNNRLSILTGPENEKLLKELAAFDIDINR